MNTGSVAVPDSVDSVDGDDGPPDSDVRLGRRVAAVAVAAGFLVLVVVNAALPASPFDLFPVTVKRIVGVVAPQGWSFFTKSPRSPSIVVYRSEPGGVWRDITAGPGDRLGDALGIDRAGRGQGTELAILMERIPKEAWRTCEESPLVCLAESVATATVTNGSHRSVCGDVGFVVQEVRPWAWRDAPTVMPSNVARVRVTC